MENNNTIKDISLKFRYNQDRIYYLIQKFNNSNNALEATEIIKEFDLLTEENNKIIDKFNLHTP